MTSHLYHLTLLSHGVMTPTPQSLRLLHHTYIHPHFCIPRHRLESLQQSQSGAGLKQKELGIRNMRERVAMQQQSVQEYTRNYCFLSSTMHGKVMLKGKLRKKIHPRVHSMGERYMLSRRKKRKNEKSGGKSLARKEA